MITFNNNNNNINIGAIWVKFLGVIFKKHAELGDILTKKKPNKMAFYF